MKMEKNEGILMKTNLLKNTAHIFGAIFVLLLLCCLIPAKADAATYQTGSLYHDSTKLGNTYFWTSDYKQLRCGDSQDGEGTLLFDCAAGGSDMVWLSHKLISNGNTVYFSVNDSVNSCYVIYSCKTDGTGLKKIKTIKTPEGTETYINLVSVYNNVLFFDRYVGKDEEPSTKDGLYSIGLKSGTLKKRLSNFVFDYAAGGTRYIYYLKDNSDGSVQLRAYDCKSFKSVSIAKKANALGYYDGKLYYSKYTSSSIKVYSCTASGKDDKLVVTLNNAQDLSMKGSVITYRVDAGNWNFVTYTYNVKTKQTQQV